MLVKSRLRAELGLEPDLLEERVGEAGTMSWSCSDESLLCRGAGLERLLLLRGKCDLFPGPGGSRGEGGGGEGMLR